MLRIDARELDGVVVLDLVGPLNLGPPIKLLAQHIQSAVQRPEPRVLLNLKAVTFIDSMGLGELVASYTTVRKHGGNLLLAAPGEFVAQVLQVARLPDVIKVYETADHALADLAH
jgi:anti-sigma B factor antagonist